jgi:chemotaxis signal transduction protein
MSPEAGEAYLVFRAGGERLGLAVDQVQGVARARQIVPLPGAPPEYAGVTFVRGEPLGVLDAVRALGCLPEATVRSGGAGGRFLVILEGERHALLVDRIESVEEIPAEALTPASAESGIVRGIVSSGESALRIVSVDEVLGGGKR